MISSCTRIGHDGRFELIYWNTLVTNATFEYFFTKRVLSTGWRNSLCFCKLLNTGSKHVKLRQKKKKVEAKRDTPVYIEEDWTAPRAWNDLLRSNTLCVTLPNVQGWIRSLRTEFQSKLWIYDIQLTRTKMTIFFLLDFGTKQTFKFDADFFDSTMYTHTTQRSGLMARKKRRKQLPVWARAQFSLRQKAKQQSWEEFFFFLVNSRAASQIWKSLLDSGELRLCKFSSSALIDVNPLFLLLTPHPKQLQTIFCFTKTIKGKKPFFLFNCKRKLWICAWRTGTRDQYWCKINRYWAFVRNSLCCFGYPEEGGAVPG